MTFYISEYKSFFFFLIWLGDGFMACVPSAFALHVHGTCFIDSGSLVIEIEQVVYEMCNMKLIRIVCITICSAFSRTVFELRLIRRV